MTKLKFGLFLAVFAVLLVACPRAEVAMEEKGEAAVQTPSGPELTVSDHTTATKSIKVSSAVLDKPGYVAIHADSDGKPGAVIAHSGLLQAGTYSNLEVDLSTLVQGSTKVFVMLHYDNGDGTYEFPGDDAPITVSGKILVKPLIVTYQAAAVESAGQIKITKHTAIKSGTTAKVIFTLENQEAVQSSSSITVTLYYAGQPVKTDAINVVLAANEKKNFEVAFIDYPQFVSYRIEGSALVNPLNK